MCSNEIVIKMNIGVRNLIKDINSISYVRIEGISREEFWSNVKVLVKRGFDELSVDLFNKVKVGAFVEIGEVIL